ncbi:MAG TPA: uroporphyrinogen decarboxylase family protein [Vicinamibacteria bacterium]
MNSRERVLAAVEHRPVDRVPVDFGGHRSSGIMAIAYGRLKRHLGIASGDVYVYDVIQQLAIVEEAVRDELGVDTVEMGRGFLLDPGEWKDWTLPDGTPCKVPGYVSLERRGDDWYLLSARGTPVGLQKKGCLYFDQIHYPLAPRAIEDDTFEDLEAALDEVMWSVPHPGAHLALDDAGLAEMAARARALRASTDRAILALFGGNLFETGQMLYGMERFLAELALRPDDCARLAEALTRVYLVKLEKWLGAIGPHVDVVLFGDDLGGQGGPLISPATYRRVFAPFHQQMWRRAKELAGVKVQLHSCGGIEPFLGDFVEMGLDAVNPVQTSARGMSPAALKGRHGDRLCFWGGGCDTHRVLPSGTPEEVAAHVREQAAVMARGSGFVFQQVHNVMADVPPENVVAMHRAAAELRGEA